jgi:hypothetical protein
VQLQPHGVGVETTTRQPRPDEGVLALLDPLLGGAAAIVKSDDPLGRAVEIGNDEADPRIELARMPLDLGDDTAGLRPALRLVAEAGIGAANVLGRTWGASGFVETFGCG